MPRVTAAVTRAVIMSVHVLKDCCICPCLELAAVKLDEAPVWEEDLLPHNGCAQRRGALEPLLLHRGCRGLLLCSC